MKSWKGITDAIAGWQSKGNGNISSNLSRVFAFLDIVRCTKRCSRQAFEENLGNRWANTSFNRLIHLLQSTQKKPRFPWTDSKHDQPSKEKWTPFYSFFIYPPFAACHSVLTSRSGNPFLLCHPNSIGKLSKKVKNTKPKIYFDDVVGRTAVLSLCRLPFNFICVPLLTLWWWNKFWWKSLFNVQIKLTDIIHVISVVTCDHNKFASQVVPTSSSEIGNTISLVQLSSVQPAIIECICGRITFTTSSVGNSKQIVHLVCLSLTILKREIV